jgi:hypothetical protein
MITIENCRPTILLLPVSKVTLKPKGRVSLLESTAEIERAVKSGWVKIVDPEAGAVSDQSDSPRSDSGLPHEASLPAGHDWLIDYTEAEDGKITISDRSTGRSVVAEVAERKGDQHYTLRNLGTVKMQQYWPTALALEQFDAAE